MSFVSYAQNLEDVMLWRALKHVKDGFYIDVGAWSPDIDSVTRAFYERGWHGINIEPNPEFLRLCTSNRPRDINLGFALSDCAGQAEMYFVSNSGLSSLDKSIAESHASLGCSVSQSKVEVSTLAMICQHHADARDIHFLKVDVEGLEEKVLAGNDWTRFRPWIVVVEATLPMSQTECYESWEPILLNANYVLAYADGLNRFYVARERAELLPAFRYPPNVFDQFRLGAHVEAETRATQAEAGAAQIEEQLHNAKEQTRMLRESEAGRAAQGEQIETLVAILRVLFSRPGFRWLTKFVNWPEVKKLSEQLGKPNVGMNKSLKNIAVDLTPVLPGGENGGAKIFVLELLRRLAEMRPQTQFVLLTQAASHEELAALDRPNMRRLMVIGSALTNFLRPRLLGLVFRVLPYLPASLRSTVIRFRHSLSAALRRNGSGVLLRNMGIDLLFCPFTAPTYFEPGIPTVCTIYDLQHKTYPEFFAAEEVAHRDRIFIEACRRASALTAISDYSRDSAIGHGSLDPARIRTIHLRMAQRISPRDEHNKGVLRRLSLTPQQYLIYPANFWKHKNHEMLLTAFGMACHEGLAAGVKLVCTGAPGARRDWLMSTARNMNLADRVLFPGYLPNAELAALIANCSGVVFPSLYEGFGLPIIEAMAAGVPVACGNTTSLPEVAADAAMFFDPRIPTQIAQAMVSLVEDEALRARLIPAGQQRATEFSDTERMAREYWDLFEYALANEKQENLLTGVYADGWAGPSLNIQVAPAASAQSLEIVFSAPEWLPQPKLTVQASLGGKPLGVPFEVVRGANVLWSLLMAPAGGYYEIRIAPTFVPASMGHEDDQRVLSMMLQRCGIVRADGECIELFPNKVSA
ncbi:MAG: FkbM family methyltransferase [Sulfuricaulis sp.]